MEGPKGRLPEYVLKAKEYIHIDAMRLTSKSTQLSSQLFDHRCLSWTGALLLVSDEEEWKLLKTKIRLAVRILTDTRLVRLVALPLHLIA